MGVLAKQDLKKGDILYKVGGQRLETGEQLETLLAKCKDGDVVEVEIHRTTLQPEPYPVLRYR